MTRPLLALLAAACLVPVGVRAVATTIVPTSDAQVIETLPAAAGRREDRDARRHLAQWPGDAAIAADFARRQLQRAREQGDPRFAGQALAVLSHWSDGATAPPDVLLLQATLQQFLHRFDDAAATLDVLLKREPRQAQAWLTLATVRRVQGRYAESDTACAGVQASGQPLHAAACRAENAALRGRVVQARATLAGLLGSPRFDPRTRAWLLTTLAELEMRAGESAGADRAYRGALAAAPDDYARLSYADFLIGLGRHDEALETLRPMTRTDAVVLRLAIAGARAGAPAAAADAREMRERIAAANLRPDAQVAHAREQAMFALWIERDPARALALARTNVQAQREPLDLLLLAQAARAAGDAPARREAAGVVAGQGLRDVRIDALR